jgi:hypothetical protein
MYSVLPVKNLNLLLTSEIYLYCISNLDFGGGMGLIVNS